MLDAWRLSVGTLTALRVGHPSRVDRRTAGAAMLLAPLAVIPLGLLVGVIGWAGRELDLAPVAVAVVAVGALATGSRALHLDGLSDVADALTASYDRERSLEVMKGGTSGPAGSAALVLVLGLQVAALASVLSTPRGPVVAAVLVCASRAMLVVTCARGVPAAREGGLAASYVGTVTPLVAVLSWVVVGAIAAGVLGWAGYEPWRGVVVAAAGLVVGAALTYRCVRRFGGVTGDVFGAAIEVSLATMLLGAT
ncbi:adenosylcobinamide-GDP ribazoletransferase [Aeromicrobium fastidiosum]|uniref:Adenosylcobinamide-GDP ribazoletransferase n=1 Tax=Aeromicrobium fastidiosum TaxID=52699 RepID=A0A641APJ7_9ACTN|nr:adenosylcobinamide-GDP ribazoletransferase [Aeromicrobium fastidiosum]KAA1380024.1 adenosylcobinamide-GDP ribazoletransferase [Aeromicrobium fastidiosum]MBP2389547.1 adenosylcobinamide-GDP ribazoletransferase [Aeromicrobium fastidiosum]